MTRRGLYRNRVTTPGTGQARKLAAIKLVLMEYQGNTTRTQPTDTHLAKLCNRKISATLKKNRQQATSSLNFLMKEIAILLTVAASSIFILGYSIHMLIGDLVSQETEKWIIAAACTIGVVIILFMAWDIMKQRRLR